MIITGFFKKLKYFNNADKKTYTKTAYKYNSMWTFREFVLK